MGDNPAMTPPFQKSGQGKARFFKNLKVTYIMKDGTLEDGSAYSFCMVGVVKTGEAFGVVLVVKGEVGEREREERRGRVFIYS